MSENKNRVPILEAGMIVNDIFTHLARFTDKIEIAGSLRRQVDTIGDIEFVILPKILTSPQIEQLSMLGDQPGMAVPKPSKNLTFTALSEMIGLYNGDWFRLAEYGKKDGTKYKKFEVVTMQEQWVQVDMFFATPENFGLIYLMRTGPADFSKYMLTGNRDGGALPPGYYSKGGYLRYEEDENIIPIIDERGLFTRCGFEYLQPEDRNQWRKNLIQIPRTEAPKQSAGWEAI